MVSGIRSAGQPDFFSSFHLTYICVGAFSVGFKPKYIFFACCIISSQTWTAHAHESGKTTLLSTSAPSVNGMLAETRCGQGQATGVRNMSLSTALSDFKNVVKCIDHVLQKNSMERHCSGNIFSLICPNMWPMWAMFTP